MDEPEPPELRRLIVTRAQGHCEYCKSQQRYATESFHIEHIMPLSRGGETNLDNLALACPGCNAHKSAKVSAKDPVMGTVVPLYHPRLQGWLDHFSWSEDALLIIGLTAIGRATVEALRMNRENLVNLRHVLAIVGKHPPQESGQEG